MAMFDYSCDCGEVKKDVLVRSGEERVIHCEGCKKIMTKMIGTPSFMFKQPQGTYGGRIMQIAKKDKK